MDKLKARDFNATSLPTYDFSTFYTTLPHLIKDKLIDLTKRTFNREGSPYLACFDRNAFFLLHETLKNIKHGLFKNVCDVLTFLLDNIFIRFGSKNSRQPRGTARKSRSTITRHQEDKLSKATSPLFPIKMIAILEWT